MHIHNPQLHMHQCVKQHGISMQDIITTGQKYMPTNTSICKNNTEPAAVVEAVFPQVLYIAYSVPPVSFTNMQILHI